MNKKGIVWETISDVFLAGLIIFIGLTMFFLLNGLHQNRVNTYMDQKVSNLDNDEIFVSYLNAEIQNELTLS